MHKNTKYSKESEFKMKKRYIMLIITILSIISLLLGINNFTDAQQVNQILLMSRIPRLISIIIVGVGISICGLIMQQVTQNKFVSPTTGATMDSAQLGLMVSTVMLPYATIMQKLSISFIFSILGTFLFINILKGIRFKNSVIVPLIGIMVGNVISSITTFIAYKENLTQNLTSFTQGEFSMMTTGRYEILYIIIPLIIIAYIYSDKFSIIGLGEEMSSNLGIEYKNVVNIGLLIVAIVTASIIVTVGSVSFVGLIVPNIVSMYYGDNVKHNTKYVASLGVIIMLVCDIISRVVIYPYEVPIGLTIGVFGVGMFMVMLLRRNKIDV